MLLRSSFSRIAVMKRCCLDEEAAMSVLREWDAERKQH